MGFLSRLTLMLQSTLKQSGRGYSRKLESMVSEIEASVSLNADFQALYPPLSARHVVIVQVLALGVWFFSGTRMSRDELIRVFFWFLVPLAGIGFLGMDAIASAGDIEFTLNSNYVTSGGYAPNQVSTVLGLASFACFLILVISSTSNVVLKALAFAGMLYFAGHAAVTMSRGGLYGAGAGMLAAGFFFAQSPRARGSLILGALLGGVLVWLLIFPRLNDFTKGKLQQRFEKTTTAGRSELMQMELELWRENFLLGVGPGKTGPLMRGQLTHRPAPHTEFTRMLGEHGLLGLGALLVLVWISVRMVSRAPSQQARAVTAGLMVWTIMNMMSAAMRLAAPGFFFGLAACLFALETGQPQAGPAPRRR